MNRHPVVQAFACGFLGALIALLVADRGITGPLQEVGTGALGIIALLAGLVIALGASFVFRPINPHADVDALARTSRMTASESLAAGSAVYQRSDGTIAPVRQIRRVDR